MHTIVDVAGEPLDGEHFTAIAGPCAIESRSQTLPPGFMESVRRVVASTRAQVPA